MIQDAINEAEDGCEIVVSPGMYFENINFGGKNIILRSTDPTNDAIMASTTIDGRSRGSVVTFSGTELSTCILEGFSIAWGSAPNGGAICGNGTAATIQYNWIKNNAATGAPPDGNGGALYRCNGTIQNNEIKENSAANSGGALYHCNGDIVSNLIWVNSAASDGGGLYDCDGKIIQNDILYNSADDSGGGLMNCDGPISHNGVYANSAFWYGGGLCSCSGLVEGNAVENNVASVEGGGLHDCNGTIQNNYIIWNSAHGYGEGGGGLSQCNGIIQNNTIYGNLAQSDITYGSGLYDCWGIIRNCVIWENTIIGGFDPQQASYCSTPSYSCIQDWTGGGTGNITSDPQLADPHNFDFHLLASSPCIDAGCSVPLTRDFEGDPRPYDGTPQPRGDGSDFDIGADEAIWHTLTVFSAYDTPVPAGTTIYTSGTIINAYMENPTVTDDDTRHICTGWLGEGTVPPTGSNTFVTFVLDQPSTITWLWKTQYYLNATADPPSAGSVTLLDGVTPATAWHDELTTVTIRAVASSGYQFYHWSGDFSGDDNPEDLFMDSPKYIVANFAIIPTPTPTPTPTPLPTPPELKYWQLY